MKVIVSHDIDHISTWEHKKDLIIPKVIIRGLIELGLKHISAKEVTRRLIRIAQNKLHNLEELMLFNKDNSIPATFFIGMSNGSGLSYPLTSAEAWIAKILENGFDMGVHGIAHSDLVEINKEHDTFRQLTGMDKFGIRMHYLNRDDNTFSLLNQANYAYDSSLVSMKNPFKIMNMWEFPLHIMDAYIIERDSKWQSLNLDKSKQITRKIIEDASRMGLNYLTVLFHDIYFSNGHKTWKEWYTWLVQYIKESGMTFISYRDAIRELEVSNE